MLVPNVDLLNDRRKVNGWNILVTADKANLNYQIAWKLLAKHCGTPDTVRRIALALGIEPSSAWVEGGTPPSHSPSKPTNSRHPRKTRRDRRG